MTALIVIASVVPYFLIGALLALSDMPRAWDRAREAWRSDSAARDSVVMQSLFTLVLWPVMVPSRRTLRRLDRLITERDPREMQRRLDERERQIAKLERELGLGEQRGRRGRG